METKEKITNKQIVQDAYAHFAKGNIPALLNNLTDDVIWTTPGPKSIIPWVGIHKGKQQVAEFFKLINENIEFLKFEPKEYITEGDKVVVLGHWEAKSKKSGKTGGSDWTMVFTLKNGKVCEYHEYSDTYVSVITFGS
jgi:ketosteroid isomerase-like protein